LPGEIGKDEVISTAFKIVMQEKQLAKEERRNMT